MNYKEMGEKLETTEQQHKQKQKFKRRMAANTLRNKEEAARKINKKAKAALDLEQQKKRDEDMKARGPLVWVPDPAALKRQDKLIARLRAEKIARAMKKKLKGIKP